MGLYSCFYAGHCRVCTIYMRRFILFVEQCNKMGDEGQLTPNLEKFPKLLWIRVHFKNLTATTCCLSLYCNLYSMSCSDKQKLSWGWYLRGFGCHDKAKKLSINLLRKALNSVRKNAGILWRIYRVIRGKFHSTYETVTDFYAGCGGKR